ncbi:MAG: hypothetical protein ACREDF_08015, partial [Thermoplasmata archaeon]
RCSVRAELRAGPLIIDQPVDVRDCRVLGEIKARDEKEQDNASERNHARNQAVALGGNTVFITSKTTGVVYQCPAAQPPGAAR